MSILISVDDLLARRRVATGALAPLAAGLRRELEPLIASPPQVPTLKAHLLLGSESAAILAIGILVYRTFRPRVEEYL